jgi:hypothetical protein
MQIKFYSAKKVFQTEISTIFEIKFFLISFQ